MIAVEELDTPALVVDLDALERNIAEMQEVARAAGVRLRPHTTDKTKANRRSALISRTVRRTSR